MSESILDFFGDFKVKKPYEKLYHSFEQDGDLIKGEKYKAVFSTPGNHYYDPETGKEHIVYPEEEVLDFHSDYLSKIIDEKANEYLRIYKDIKLKYLTSPTELYYLINGVVEDLGNDRYFFEHHEPLNEFPEIRNKLLNTLDELLIKMQPKDALEPPIEFNKIKFNLKKSEVCFLFYWLKEHGFLENSTDNEMLSKKMQKHFLRQASLDRNEYIEFKDSTSEFSKIAKGKILPSKRLLEFIEKINKQYSK
ncbi:hypothetical protein [Pseudotenacibaculum haliotis]|uniref:Uncharacterized protein n=1 Tax=Pseudotenacibaculum haliotis TaxID=1862138 RepID=A0ABW5LY07_9FLAO